MGKENVIVSDNGVEATELKKTAELGETSVYNSPADRVRRTIKIGERRLRERIKKLPEKLPPATENSIVD